MITRKACTKWKDSSRKADLERVLIKSSLDLLDIQLSQLISFAQAGQKGYLRRMCNNDFKKGNIKQISAEKRQEFISPRGASHSSWKCLLLTVNEIKGEEGEERERGVNLPADGAYRSAPFMTLATPKPIKRALAPSPLLLQQNQKQEVAVQRRNGTLFYPEVALLLQLVQRL